MQIKKLVVGVALLVNSSVFASNANSLLFEVGGGLTGLNGGVGYQINPQHSLRLTGTIGSMDLTIDPSDVGGNIDVGVGTFTSSIETQMIGLISDFRPFNNNWYFSAGVISNKNKFEASYEGASVQVDDLTFTLDGSVTAEVTFPSLSGYAGIGWATQNRGLNYGFDIGLLMHGQPGVNLSYNDPSLTPAEQTALDAKLVTVGQEINTTIQDMEYLPILNAKIQYSY